MPDRQPDHCARLAVLALDMLSALAGYEDDVGRPLQVCPIVNSPARPWTSLCF